MLAGNLRAATLNNDVSEIETQLCGHSLQPVNMIYTQSAQLVSVSGQRSKGPWFKTRIE
jgi:hypothetical protein